MRPPGFVSAATLLILVAMAHAAEVWKWTDANGVVHYSDQPGPGAKRVELNAQTFTAPQPAAPSRSAGKTTTASPAAVYTRLEILQPSPEETITGTGGQVSVRLRVEPALASDHTLALSLDGSKVEGFPPTATEYELKEVDRGEHTLTAVINNAKGQQVMASPPVKFYVQRPSVLRRTG